MPSASKKGVGHDAYYDECTKNTRLNRSPSNSLTSCARTPSKRTGFFLTSNSTLSSSLSSSSFQVRRCLEGRSSWDGCASGNWDACVSPDGCNGGLPFLFVNPSHEVLRGAPGQPLGQLPRSAIPLYCRAILLYTLSTFPSDLGQNRIAAMAEAEVALGNEWSGLPYEPTHVTRCSRLILLYIGFLNYSWNI